MISKIQRRIGIVCVILLSIFTVGSAFAQVPIRLWGQVPVNQCGQVLSQPGNYVLTTDLNCGGRELQITASHVRLDTAGHILNTFIDGIRIADGVSHVRIYGGGSIEGGVVIGADHDISLKNLRVSGSSSFGPGALIIGGATKVKVIHSAITLRCSSSGGAAISGTVDHGVFVDNTIVTQRGCFAPIGVVILTGTGNVIRGNALSFNSGLSFAFAIRVTSQNIIEANTIQMTSSGRPMELGGISLAGDSNRVRNNTIQAVPPAGLYGIFAAQGAVDNAITKNNVSGNQFDLFEDNGSCVNTWKHNTFQTRGGLVACIN